MFSTEVITQWNKKPQVDQTYANATVLFEAEKKDMDKIDCLMGNDKAGKSGFSSANAAVKWGEEVNIIIQEAVVQVMATKDSKHALSMSELRSASSRELERVHSALDYLKERVEKLANKATTNTNNNGGGGGGGNNNNNSDTDNNNNNSKKQKKTVDEKYGTWTASIKYSNDWTGAKKIWFNCQQRINKWAVNDALRKSDIGE